MTSRVGFVRHLLHAAPVIAVVSLVVFVLSHGGFLRTFETAALDTWLRLKAPQPVANVVIVAITDCDYRELFGETSPLNAGRVSDLVHAIVAGRPKVVGVDLDTSHSSFAALAVPEAGVPVVWARDRSQSKARRTAVRGPSRHRPGRRFRRGMAGRASTLSQRFAPWVSWVAMPCLPAWLAAFR